ncbi:hypothetical protein [Blautia obeum]|uniref:hypothetical protein n=1 Tax=Blautia obeum TaxID=40520 RepID=UPI00356AD28F
MSKKPPLQNQRFKWWEHVTNLIGYFEKVNEPTMIVMFGDHWPKLEDGFYSKLL